MRTIYDKNIVSSFKDKTIFLDTSALILAISSDQSFLEFLFDLKQVGCSFMTIPSVLFEFTRGSDTLEIFNKRTSFVLEDLNIGIYPIEKHLDEIREFMVVLQKIAKDNSYTDFLLCCCMYKFQNSYVLTENHNHFPISILKREEIITIETDTYQIRNSAIYKFSSEKFEKASGSILRTD